MKTLSLSTILLVGTLLLIFSSNTLNALGKKDKFSKTFKTYRTSKNGFWDDVTVWQIKEGNSWVDAKYHPFEGDKIIISQNTDIIVHNMSVSLSDVIVENNAVLTFSQRSEALLESTNIIDGSLIINGSFVIEELGKTLGKGSLEIKETAKLYIRNKNGISIGLEDGNLATLDVELSTNAKYVYDGKELQNTGDALPTYANNIFFLNPSGVRLSNANINTMQLETVFNNTFEE
jgi:hypothetical protein